MTKRHFEEIIMALLEMFRMKQYCAQAHSATKRSFFAGGAINLLYGKDLTGKLKMADFLRTKGDEALLRNDSRLF